ncbi:hypothetical protein Dxin01_04118 [Deinococcus xinjiangensis]|uniref:Uncharacterized protein n=1 Tax=Deinococcus xinjiangensis TaxID=457454 RepID=A0ABP9VJQ7_9DEIO
MTHLTQEAQARASKSSNRAAARDKLVNQFFNPYTFLGLVLLIGGIGLVFMDAKGFPLLLVAAVFAAILRLLWTIREELRRQADQQADQNALLRASLGRTGK